MAFRPSAFVLLYRKISTSPVLPRQKIPYVQSYKWLLDVCKSRRRARYPWIPREPPSSCLINGEAREIPEMRVEFIVPKDLDKCDLKPYVSWQADVINEPPLTADYLFELRYADQVRSLYEEGKNVEEVISKL